MATPSRPAPGSGHPRRLVAIGASAGGVRALRTLVSRLPAGFDSTLLVVLHTGAHRSLLPGLLSSQGALPASFAADEQPIAAGRIYVAPPDMHLHVEGDRLRVSHGPKENFARPAVDPLFRSVAIARGPAAVGVVLTGHLDDGTAGLQAIKRHGGIAIVQDPVQAEAPGMPRSAMRHVDVDHCLPIEAIADTLVAIAATPPAAAPRPDRVADTEHSVWLARGDPMKQLDSLGEPSRLVCPECGGSLWHLAGSRPSRYRCHTGHAYSLGSLHHAQAHEADRAIWTAIRALQEKQRILEEMADGSEPDAERGADELHAEARQLREHVAMLRMLAERTPADPID